MNASGEVARLLALPSSKQREVLRLRLVAESPGEGTTQKRALLSDELVASWRRKPED